MALLSVPAAAQQGTTYTVHVASSDPPEASGDTRHVPLHVTVEAQGFVCPEGGTFQLSIVPEAWLMAPTAGQDVTAQAVPDQLMLTYPGTAGLGGSLQVDGDAQVVVRVAPVPEPGALVVGNVTVRLESIACASTLPLPVGSPGASGTTGFQVPYRPQDRSPPEQVTPFPFVLGAVLTFAAARARR